MPLVSQSIIRIDFIQRTSQPDGWTVALVKCDGQCIGGNDERSETVSVTGSKVNIQMALRGVKETAIFSNTKKKPIIDSY